jgi:hypothetical protein
MGTMSRQFPSASAPPKAAGLDVAASLKPATDTALADPPTPGPPKLYRPTPVETFGGLGILAVYALVFGVGVIFPSRPFMEALQQAALGERTLPWHEIIGRLVAFLFTYTATNAAVLCCLSAWLGELGRRTRIDGRASLGGVHPGDYVAAIMRGFLGYLAVIAGFIVIGPGVNLFTSPQQGDYVRLAALVSLLGFLTGFSPSLFRGIEERFSGNLRLQQGSDGRVQADVHGPADVRIHADASSAPAPGKAPPTAAGNGPPPGGSATPTRPSGS